MTSELVTKGIWSEITRIAKAGGRTAFVAVPYFSTAGATLLPLSTGSRLVVNASELAVKTGQTSPAALLALHRRGVQVFSNPTLHAKIYVFGRVAFVGSANASASSAHGLIEAMVRTTDRRVVADAREFVRRLCQREVPMGEGELGQLAKLYREPRGGRSVGRRGRPKSQAGPRTWLVDVSEDDLRGEAVATCDEGLVQAKRSRAARRHLVEVFWHSRRVPYRRRDKVIEVVRSNDGRIMVTAPGTVLHFKEWRRGKKRLTFTYYERPPGRRVGLGGFGVGFTKRPGEEVSR